MPFEFDPAKDRANLAKHGISLKRAADLTAVVEDIDDTVEYGEERIIGTGLIDGRVFVCVYTMRGTVRRVISLRGATKREADVYYATDR